MELNTQQEYKTVSYFDDAANENVDTGCDIDDSSAILMDGQYLIPSKALLIPEDETQYFVQDTGDILFNCTDENAVYNHNEVFHLVDNSDIEGNQIVYFANDTSPKEDLYFMDIFDTSLKKTDTEFLDLQPLIDIKTEHETMENHDTNELQYIVELQDLNAVQTIEEVKTENIIENIYNSETADVKFSQLIDTSIITGKNLFTGQMVTIDSNIEKAWNSSRESRLKKKNEHTALSNLLNKKLTIGKTLSGQRLIGKVIHVGKVDVEEEQTVIQEGLVDFRSQIDGFDESLSYYDVENQVPNSVIIGDNQNDDENILLNNINEMLVLDKTENVSETIEINEHSETEIDDNEPLLCDIKEYVSKTMHDLMSMDKILKKLKRKNLLIKVLESVVEDDQMTVNTYQIGGHVEMLGGWQKHEYEEKWLFKTDFEKEGEDGGEWMETWSRKFSETMKLMISVVKVNGVVQSTNVNLNYGLEKCTVCSKGFKSVHKLKTHMKLSHNVDRQYKCQICDESLENKETYDQHVSHHVENRDLFPCSNCDEQFSTEQKLKKHLQNHYSDSLKLSCAVCGDNFEKISTWREHTLKHDKSNKQFQGKLRDTESFCQSKDVAKNCYVCKVCNRTFSRYSNLQRHSEIHDTKNSMALYSCSMCGCAYNYISSLTRHIVQNHISAT